MRVSGSFSYLAALGLLLTACSDDRAGWDKIKTPTAAPAQAIGSYAGGCLAGAQALPRDGMGYQVMRSSRGRYYGHPVLLDYLRSLAQYADANGGTLLVGDLAQPRGGPILSGHASHQLGLEADLWYASPDDAELLNEQQREDMPAPSLVQADGKAVDSALWKPYYAKLLRHAASDARVARIFVGPAIKKKLCETEKDRSWLRKLRPWWKHDDHFHVRLACPAGDKTCVSQPDAIPPGDGCDATLDWWFTDEARDKQDKPDIAMSRDLPAACRALRDAP